MISGRIRFLRRERARFHAPSEEEETTPSGQSSCYCGVLSGSSDDRAHTRGKKEKKQEFDWKRDSIMTHCTSRDILIYSYD